MAVGAALAACATKMREIPARPLVPRAPTAIVRDQQECDRAVTGKVKGPWLPGELEFAACMIARDYQTFVQVLDAPVEVRKASARARMAPARVLADLMACEHTVEAKVSMVEKIGRPAVTVIGFFFWPLGVGSTMAAPALHVQRRHDYALCMEPRGYVVTAWQPEPEPVSSRGDETQ